MVPGNRWRGVPSPLSLVRRTRPRAVTVLATALMVLFPTVATAAVAGEQTASAAPAVLRSSAALRVSPTNYVGGQRLTWKGNVGHRGERPLVLQFNMGSAVGNAWDTVEGFSARTRADGSFSFGYPAPSMFNIRYRVKAGEYVTPAKVFNAKTQDLTVRLTGQPENSTNEPGRVKAGRAFGITVDTTPENIYRSPESQGLPVFRGRALTLQRRVDGRTWRTVGTTSVGRHGLGHFAGLKRRAGVTVYRVRQENYVAGGNQIGWTQSFPLYVLVGKEAQRWYATRYGAARAARTSPRRPAASRLGAQPTTASQRYAWFPSLFDFTWEHGQSLSSPPARGTRLQGHWVDFSNGTGRVQKYNGGLALDSKRYAGAGPGDFGITRATLQGNAITEGRWETSLRIRNAFERGDRPYRILAELIPAQASDYDCGRHNITIARISPFSREVRFGVRSGANRWEGSTRAGYTPLTNAFNVGVEVARGHITWFLNSTPVGSVTTTAALPRVPLTLRLSLVGQRRHEMNQTGLISDWQRGFPISTGRPTVSQRKLPRSDAPPNRCGST